MTHPTPDELSRLIAEKLEPIASLGNMVTRMDGHTESRPLGLWVSPPSNSTIWKEWPWQPRDMTADPAMTLMLLEKMRPGTQLNKLHDGKWIINGWFGPGLPFGEAVALAYARMEGLLK
jgi:hypothetical protein